MALNFILKGCLHTGILFLFTGCILKGKQTNDITIENAAWYQVPESKLSSGDNKLDVYVLRLYPDYTYTLCADLLFETGRWTNDETKEAFVLMPDKISNGSASYFVQETTTPQGNIVFSFFDSFPFEVEPVERIEVQGIATKTDLDPFKASMHLWRKKPAVPETNDQIKLRVMQYLQFLEALYTHALENKLQNPGGTWYPQPIKFYTNKVSMAYADELVDWYNCFYNDEQGIEGYKLISGALRNVKIKGDNDNSRNVDCVKQLLANL